MADGKLKEISSIYEIQSGCIVRMKGTEVAPFSDCIVQKIENVLNVNHRITLSRPYAFVSGVGTTSPTVLLGQETFEVDFDRLQKYYVQVLTDRECSYDFVT